MLIAITFARLSHFFLDLGSQIYPLLADDVTKLNRAKIMKSDETFPGGIPKKLNIFLTQYPKVIIIRRGTVVII